MMKKEKRQGRGSHSKKHSVLRRLRSRAVHAFVAAVDEPPKTSGATRRSPAVARRQKLRRRPAEERGRDGKGGDRFATDGDRFGFVQMVVSSTVRLGHLNQCLHLTYYMQLETWCVQFIPLRAPLGDTLLQPDCQMSELNLDSLHFANPFCHHTLSTSIIYIYLPNIPICPCLRVRCRGVSSVCSSRTAGTSPSMPLMAGLQLPLEVKYWTRQQLEMPPGSTWRRLWSRRRRRLCQFTFT